MRQYATPLMLTTLLVLVVAPVIIPSAEAVSSSFLFQKTFSGNEAIGTDFRGNQCVGMNGASGIVVSSVKNTGDPAPGVLVARRTTNNFGTSSTFTVDTSGDEVCESLYHITGNTYIMLTTGQVWRTTDNGASWTAGVFSTNDGWENCIANLDGTNLIGIRVDGGVGNIRSKTSSDSGATWSAETVASVGVVAGGGCSVIASSFSDFVVIISGFSSGIRACTTTDSGVSYSCATVVNNGNNWRDVSCIGLSNGNIGCALVDVSADQLFYASNAGGTWARTVIYTYSCSTCSLNVDIQTLEAGNLALMFFDGMDGANTVTDHFALSDDFGATWTFSRPFNEAGISTGYYEYRNGMDHGFFAYSPSTGRLTLVWQDDTTSTRVQQRSITIPEECLSLDDDCSFTIGTPKLSDVRLSFTPSPQIYTRFEGDTGGVASDGDIFYLSQDGSTQESVKPCTGTNEFTPVLPFRGFTPTIDNYLVVVCQQSSGEPRTKILHPTFLTNQATSTSLGPGVPTRLDGFNRNLITLPHLEGFMRHVDPLRSESSTGHQVGQTIYGSSLDSQSGISAITGLGGTTVFQALNSINSNEIISDPTVTGYAIAIDDFAAWIVSDTELSYYEWNNQTGFTLLDTSSTFTVSALGHVGASGIRLSKDNDYFVTWHGSSARIGNSDSLALIKTVSPGVTIEGCDMDMLNNFLWCAGGSKLFRYNVSGDVPTTWGVAKNGLRTDPTNETVLSAIGTTFTQHTASGSTSGAGSASSPTNPGQAGGFVEEDVDTFFGAPLAPIATGFGVSLTAVKWLVGIFLIGLLAMQFSQRGQIMGMLGAALGVFWAVYMGYIPLAVLFGLMLIVAAFVASLMGRSLNGEE